jgi:hypothetical protein
MDEGGQRTEDRGRGRGDQDIRVPEYQEEKKDGYFGEFVVLIGLGFWQLEINHNFAK